jgi:hypothetical protein
MTRIPRRVVIDQRFLYLRSGVIHRSHHHQGHATEMPEQGPCRVLPTGPGRHVRRLRRGSRRHAQCGGTITGTRSGHRSARKNPMIGSCQVFMLKPPEFRFQRGCIDEPSSHVEMIGDLHERSVQAHGRGSYHPRQPRAW